MLSVLGSVAPLPSNEGFFWWPFFVEMPFLDKHYCAYQYTAAAMNDIKDVAIATTFWTHVHMLAWVFSTSHHYHTITVHCSRTGLSIDLSVSRCYKCSAIHALSG